MSPSRIPGGNDRQPVESDFSSGDSGFLDILEPCRLMLRMDYPARIHSEKPPEKPVKSTLKKYRKKSLSTAMSFVILLIVAAR
ncbi:hypothetical protein ABEV00_03360 [Paenibacillus thiaminolyticus]|uniref:hypothetical protein n=1 Tax=Paenibacillus thiaminolyticus TaxID=49283 RepID=UPI003D2DC0C0